MHWERWADPHQAMARLHSDVSGGRAVIERLRSMRTPGEVLSFAVANEGADAEVLEAALRSLGRLAASGQARERIAADGRFNVLVGALASRLEHCDSKALALAADAAARFQAASPELLIIAERAAQAAVVRENAFSPRSLTMLALALAARGVRDVPAARLGVERDGAGFGAAPPLPSMPSGPGAAVMFVRGEAMRQLQEFEPICCMALLEAFRRWGVRDPELTEMVLERIWDSFDELRTKDLVEVLTTFSKLGITRRALLRRLCRLAFQQLGQFSARQLVAIMYSLARLRFLSARDVEEVLQALMPELGRLSDTHRAQVLFAMALVGSAGSADLARALVVQYDEGLDDRGLVADVDFAWAVCALDLRDAYPEAVGRALARVFAQGPPRSYLPLLKVFDVLCLSDAVGFRLGGEASSDWREACAAASKTETSRRSASRLCSEVAEHLGRLDCAEQARGGPVPKRIPPLHMQRGLVAGPYHVDMLDEATQLVVELEPVGWPVSRQLAHRTLRLSGYRTLRLEHWDWKEMHSDADRCAFLARAVRRALDGHGAAWP